MGKKISLSPLSFEDALSKTMKVDVSKDRAKVTETKKSEKKKKQGK